MLNLDNENIGWIISSSDNMTGLYSYLYGKEYHIIPINGYYDGKFEDSVIAYTYSDNTEIKKDVYTILDYFNQDSLIVKYQGDKEPKKVSNNGKQKSLGYLMYNTDSNNKSYLYNGLSFSFLEKKEYVTPTNYEQIKKGMIVECLSERGWIKKTVFEPKTEWDKVYKILSKYDKVRIELV
jgi:hypothetical protein